MSNSVDVTFEPNMASSLISAHCASTSSTITVQASSMPSRIQAIQGLQEHTWLAEQPPQIGVYGNYSIDGSCHDLCI